jgi:hypothetical protein
MRGSAPKPIEHFTAYDLVAKWTVAKAFNRATAASAAILLDKRVRDMPFKVEAIQFDSTPAATPSPTRATTHGRGFHGEGDALRREPIGASSCGGDG